MLLLVLMVLGSASAWAQFTSGIEGTVSDPTGAVGPGGHGHNQERGNRSVANVADAGLWFFPLYHAAFLCVHNQRGGPGIQDHGAGTHSPAGRGNQDLNIRMVVGGTDSTVTVTDEAPAVETAQARVSGQVSEKEVHDLPLSGRNFYTLVVLTPGVTGLASGGGQAYAQASGDIFNPEYGVNLSANGSRAESNSFLIDSASIDSSQRNGVTNVNPNAEDVQEVRVAANNFSSPNSAAMAPPW